MTVSTAAVVVQSVLANLSGLTLEVPASARPESWADDLSAYAHEAEQGDLAGHVRPLAWPGVVTIRLMSQALGLAVSNDDADISGKVYAAAAALAAQP